MKNTLKEIFIKSVVNTVCALEKNAAFNGWMTNQRFKDKFSQKTASLINNVRSGSGSHKKN